MISAVLKYGWIESLLSRGAWIEIKDEYNDRLIMHVAPLTRSVD